MSTASSVVVRLLAASSGRLRAWMDAPQPLSARGETRAEVGVMRAVERAAVRQRGIEQVIDRMAQGWLDDRGGPSAIDWSQVRDEDTAVVVDDIWSDYSERLQHNYRIDKPTLAVYLRAWVAKQQAAELTGVNIWTDAPKDYDHGYARRTKDTFEWHIGDKVKTLVRVVVPSEEQAVFQSRRYESGLHAAFDDARLTKEREYDVKRQRREQYAQVVRDIRKKLDYATDRVPARRSKSGGYWEIGRPDVYETDQKTGRTYPRPRYESEAAAPVDVDAAIQALLEARKAFQALPSDIRREEFRLEDDIDNVLKLANREAQRLFENKKEREKEAAAWQKEIAPLRLAFQPGHALLESRALGAGRGWEPVKVWGRLLEMPDHKTGIIRTEVGSIHLISRDGVYGLSAVSVPLGVPVAVWAAGALPNVKVVATDKGTVYAYKPERYGADVIVLREDGKKVPKGSKVYDEAVTTFSGETNRGQQDQAIDVALAAYKAEHPGRQGWGPLFPVKSGEHAVMVQFHPPVGGHGWRVALEDTRVGSKGYLVWERLPKRHPTLKVLWQTVTRGPDKDAFISPHDLDEAFVT